MSHKQISIVWVPEISVPTPWRGGRGGGGLGASEHPKFIRERIKLNLKFQGGIVQTKKPSVGEEWIFSGTTTHSFLSNILHHYSKIFFLVRPNNYNVLVQENLRLFSQVASHVRRY